MPPRKVTRLTPHRAAVLEVLQSRRYHPTAAELYRQVRRRRPGVAYATIYNALEWLTHNGYVDELKFGDAASRYDGCIDPHDHLVCTRCGMLIDDSVELPRGFWSRVARRNGFHFQRYRLELYGLCPKCAKHGARAATRHAS